MNWTGVQRCFPVLDPCKMLVPKTFEYWEMFDHKVDKVKYGKGWLVNVEGHLGRPIDTLRIHQYEQTMEGEFEFGHEKTSEFFNA